MNATISRLRASIPRALQSSIGMAALLFTQLTVAQIEVLDQVVAIVDDDIILASELQERVQGVRATMESRGVERPLVCGGPAAPGAQGPDVAGAGRHITLGPRWCPTQARGH